MHSKLIFSRAYDKTVWYFSSMWQVRNFMRSLAMSIQCYETVDLLSILLLLYFQWSILLHYLLVCDVSNRVSNKNVYITSCMCANYTVAGRATLASLSGSFTVRISSAYL